jgi:ATP-binding cassette subfamily B protein
MTLKQPKLTQEFTPSLFQLLFRVSGYLKPYWKHALGMYLCLFGVLALDMLIPQFMRWIIDTGIEGANVNLLTRSVLILLGLTLIKGVLNYFMGIWSEKASQNVAFDIRNEIQTKLTHLSFSFHDKSETGELLSRAIQDVERLRFLTGRASIRILDGILTIIMTSIIMLTMDVRLALLVMITIPFLVYEAVRFGTRYRPLSLQVQKQLARLTTVVEQNLRGSQIVKAFAQEEMEIHRFTQENNLWLQLSTRAVRMQAINAPLLSLFANLGNVAIILYGGLQVMQGSLTIGVVIAFITYVGQLINPVRRLGLIIPSVAIAGSAAERIFAILDTVSEVADDPDAVDFEITKGHVRFNAVDFSFGRHKILKDINFEALPGQMVALLGATGSGKTSIINLIPRFYDPSQGCILIDDQDIRKVTLESLRSQIGIVMQDTSLFAATIKENIAFGNKNASDDEIVAAAKAAQAHEFILEQANGYETRVGERGATLSGGQKQRLAIARAILLNPKILLLDDATSSVDTETEHLIQLALVHLVRGRTTFVIAHRLSTIRNANMILVLDSGRIVAQGTHDQLLESSHHYRTIYQQQLKKQEVSQ